MCFFVEDGCDVWWLGYGVCGGFVEVVVCVEIWFVDIV